jgi:hypothetical protein
MSAVLALGRTKPRPLDSCLGQTPTNPWLVLPQNTFEQMLSSSKQSTMRIFWILIIAIALVADIALVVQLFSSNTKKLSSPTAPIKTLKNQQTK